MKLYRVNNMVIVSHGVLFIHLDLGFPGSLRDVMILHHFDFYRHWRAHFIHADGYFEYLLGDLGTVAKICSKYGDLAMWTCHWI